jgi:hypothetical protein
MRPSVNYATGERLTPELVTNVPSFTSYAQQELGLSLPLGNGRRQAWSKYCKDEMSTQGWVIDDLVLAVRFIKARRKKCRSLYGILWFVSDAQKWGKAAGEHLPDSSLHLKVAEAIAIETDDSWARRLSLASGKALEIVYSNWVKERGLA